MRKTIFILMTVCLFMVGFVAKGMAYSISDLEIRPYWQPEGGFDYGTDDHGAGLGTYLGTGSWDNYGDPTALEFFYNSGFLYVEKLELALSPSEGGLAGSWNVVQNQLPNMKYVDMLVVKGAQSFSLHQYVPAALSGIWNVGYLDFAGNSGTPPEMSFVRGFQADPIPEPGTMLLLGFGLAGLAFMRRKFSN
ncbi:PEP-CTERM protein-sorting domain-containing protein [Desulfonatronum thiosulfatophilum]|uniref:PEP-CTERM protein-sorting domain-containing protein n=1 Tax=Desulfonatronum thiosulfatophilum TaxID=617002 RepID=A0A1G6C7R0_9BACT|nr:PEP-CTERM sorting domain-containing protein [Desulfonatronum thiosulfatophilum]SDB28891.1 PEP-CTERM protein-sorting domain-containing protein [Desulfonatronum thiosulfatophilum]